MAQHSPAAAQGTASPPSLLLGAGRTQCVTGYLPGWKQPSLIVEFSIAAPPPAARLQAIATLAAQAGAEPDASALRDFAQWPAMQALLAIMLALLQRAGWPLLEKMRLLGRRASAGGTTLAVALPSLHGGEAVLEATVREVLELLQHAGTVDARANPAELLERCANALKGATPRGMNSLRFLEAAHSQGIPWRRVADNLYQFGWGARARWLDSSFTDATPFLAVRTARDKYATAALLRAAGVPVPRHALARNADHAVALAAQLGYPVVVKPANLDRGAGVSAYVTSPEAVASAYAQAARLSPRVLVEEHVAGNDYRLQVFKGEVYWVTQRIPAGVTGDGVNSVDALVATANADPRRGGPGSRGLKHIALDAEAEEWLARQSLTLAAVPAAGRYVRLRGAANVASGGTIVPVLEQAHPDNLALAARAAQLLRLDLAGIDMLLPDISKSWLTSGAAICEVNAQPQMASQLPAQLLPRLVRGQGRIPLLFMLGGGAAERAALMEAARAAGPGVGLACRDGVWIGGKQVVLAPLQSSQACMALLNDPGVTAVALHIEDAAMLHAGCPVDRIDRLLLAGPLLHEAGAAQWPETLALARHLVAQSHIASRVDPAPQWSGHPGLPAGITPLHEVLAQALREPGA